jgi:hypothetical protein
MRRAAVVIGVFLVCCAAACSLRRQSAPLSPYCRGGNPLAGVYHSQRLVVKSSCRAAIGTVHEVKFEEYDGDVHIDLRLDPAYEKLLSDGNDRVGGNLIVEIIPQDRSRVDVPSVGSRIEVVGPWVNDTEHGWNEIHPAWWISAGSIQPATEEELRAVRLLLQTGGSDGS